MRIRIADDAVRAALAFDLHKLGCETRAVGDLLEITHLESPNELLGLRFYLRAWGARHPAARVELLAS
jgi:hypothetical protein